MAASSVQLADDKIEKFKKITHIIFDVDGLLLDTETLYTEGTQKMLDEYGKTYSMDLKVKVMGKPAIEVAKIMVKELELPLSSVEFMNKLQSAMRKLMPKAELLPGAEQLLRHLEEHGVPMAVASGSSERNLKLKTTNHEELFSVFEHTVLAGSDPEVKRGKPAPDGFLVARDRFDPAPQSENVLVFEDAPNGVLSAAAAGMSVVWVPDRTVVTDVDTNPVREKALLILDSLEEFNPEWIGLPPYPQ